MNVELQAKFRGSILTRSSFMDFINAGKPVYSTLTSNPSTPDIEPHSIQPMTPQVETPKDKTEVRDTSFFHTQASSIEANIQYGTVEPTTPEYTLVLGTEDESVTNQSPREPLTTDNTMDDHTTTHPALHDVTVPQIFVTAPTTCDSGLAEAGVCDFELSDDGEEFEFYDEFDEDVNGFPTQYLTPEPYITKDMAAQARTTEIESVELEVTGIDTDPETHAHTLDDDSVSTETSESVSNESGKPTICFDESGDLYLKVGQDPGRIMLVDSRALSRVSPRLKEIVSRNQKDTKDGGDWTIELPDDDAVPFTVLLNMIHTRFEKVPAKVSLKKLYGACILTSKYEMTQVLRPVAERWFNAVGTSTGDYGLFFKKAYIAWELGFSEELSDMVGHVVLNCSLDLDDQLVIGENKERLCDFEGFQRIPILDCITEHRELALETCWYKSQKLGEQVLYSSVKGRMCGASHSREEMCLMLGKMLSKAGEEGILDLFHFGGSLDVFRSSDLDLKTLEHKISLVADYIDLCGWCPAVLETVEEVRQQLRRAADPLYLSHLRALQIQAAKVRMIPGVSDKEDDDEE
ncbi:hypothetical protein FOCG_09714 [Fusarium oxysporum f. sp. radicis-lycopersici 26381]|uniref:BTB domain-containing protein n=1 Tax=Fusarium oxysporum Fo47 TaxID=660027 RepID=W9L5W9_FUSOX|nr:uncharacterized protein FOBCDRAFT_122565 [Fusarium oxysporum Fo47]EWZ50389.1 hypothetical protein FOZG_00915 [Fusarium oxysporum Fo47]EXL49319.1 hypothetical protein FOCG_09714 [Fusarium oxysporum f. sp. radicis-lycopersici 26381]RKL45151.1 hypothetical protein BFJ70_g3170 [Fusarium oxysporum]WJG34504.1 hypothetical protein FOBCDRAFT_122565 [Fusarium oxysporum Fo47]